MTVLRVLLAATPAADRAETWALFDAAGVCVRTGRDRRAAWPEASSLEIVLAASQARIASVALPPMPSSRVAGAVGFALEDHLAGPDTAHFVAISTQAPDGHVRAAITAQALLAAVVDHGANVARVVAEADLAAPSADWKWCARELGTPGFVRRPDGSAFPVDAPGLSDTLPTELVLALAQARRGGAKGLRVHVDAPFDELSLARWQRDSGVAFVRGTPWQWESAGAAAFASAIDLLPRRERGTGVSRAATASQALAPALVIVGIALGLHVVASAAEWSHLRLGAWRDGKEWTALATAAGVPRDATAPPATSRVALSRRYAELRHSQGLPAPDDALALLARAAPALAMLPAGVVKSASYADGHWTLDLALSDATAIRDIEQRLRGVLVSALVASTSNGARMRLGGS